MKTVHKLVLKSYLGPMILTFFIVMFVLIMQFMWRYIDELVGKGLDMSVIGELMFWAAMTLIPMGLPLATLLATKKLPIEIALTTIISGRRMRGSEIPADLSASSS